MYSNYQYFPNQRRQNRTVGFLGPFLLGGLTGGLVAPYFYNNRPYYYQYGPYYGPYGPYYR